MCSNYEIRIDQERTLDSGIESVGKDGSKSVGCSSTVLQSSSSISSADNLTTRGSWRVLLSIRKSDPLLEILQIAQ